MRIPIPDSNPEYDGARTTVTVAILAVAQCPHGHAEILNVPDTDHITDHARRVTDWAIEHADTCTGTRRARLHAA